MSHLAQDFTNFCQVIMNRKIRKSILLFAQKEDNKNGILRHILLEKIIFLVDVNSFSIFPIFALKVFRIF